MRLQLTFAAGGYDFVRPLADGTIKPDGIDLVVLSGMGSGERHHRMGHGQEFAQVEFMAVARHREFVHSTPLRARVRARIECTATMRPTSLFVIADLAGGRQ